jgi:hypothetical protein
MWTERVTGPEKSTVQEESDNHVRHHLKTRDVHIPGTYAQMNGVRGRKNTAKNLSTGDTPEFTCLSRGCGHVFHIRRARAFAVVS